MASKNSSFDIVSVIDMEEVQNAVNQAMAEIGQRFDFKGSKSEITLDKKENKITILSDNDSKLNSVIDVLQGKLVKRKVSLKGLDYGKVEPATGDSVRQSILVQQGISQDKGKEITKAIKGMGLKVQSQIMDDLLRVTGKNKDDLQEAMSRLKEKDFGVAMTFTNYR
ncbi:MAG: YajQ family cyclic di-GMP-binding protein [Nitrospinae bacterium]|jgi:cyclic-di-GMP-binding protein|nr:YajQ family cyclic di-GMP-binding protein [Nitrospinota bacterium]MDA1110474.1 YajQ family cyclic di-GMP-binding protein [Nitrospinota bacterium]